MAENQSGAVDKLVYFLIGVGVGAIIALLFLPIGVTHVDDQRINMAT